MDFIYVKVEVTVQNGTETKINVDAVSGAANSSTVIMKAVENAIPGAK